jgi:outer membrane protein assembly factor BamB
MMHHRTLMTACGLTIVAGQAMAANWLTFAGSNQRQGYNGTETVLTAMTVAGLKRHWDVNLAATSETQPLFIENVATPNGTHNEVFQTTVTGKVMALNAATGSIDWHVQLPGAAPLCAPNSSTGVHGTPTIDPVAGLLYVVDSLGKLHALNIANGSEATGYPVQVIAATDLAHANYYHGSPSLVGNTLYVTTSIVAKCEGTTKFNGSVIAFDTSTEAVSGTFYPVAQPDNGGGIWGPGGAMWDAVNSNLLTATGNS